MKDIFLIDADDTILDFHGSSVVALKDAFEECELIWQEPYAEIFRTVNDSLWQALERKELTREELIKKRFPLYLSTLGLKADGEKFNERYLHSLATKPIYVEGAERLLETLRTLGKIYVVTNGTESIQRSRFAIAKLNERVDGVFVSQVVGYDKPAKEYTQYVVDHIENFATERAIWVGDSLTSDIRSANEAGITSVWFNPKGKTQTGEAMPDYTVRSLDEVVELLQNFQ